MRVALDCTSLLTPHTGVGVFCRELLHGLVARDGVEAEAFAVTWRGRDQLDRHVPAGARVAGRAMPARPLRALWTHADQPRLDWWLRGADVVHGPNFVVPPTRHAAEVVSVHDLSPVHFPEIVNPDARQYPQLIARAVARGAWVHTDSAFVANEVVEHFDVDPSRVVTVHPGVLDHAEGEGTTAADGATIAGGTHYVLALGTVEPRKNLPSLVAAFDRVAADEPGLRLVLAGPDGHGLPALRRAIEASPHSARITRLQWVDERQRSALLRGATAFVYPSRYEGFGFPPLEAQAAGSPVIATAAGSLPEVLGDSALLIDASHGNTLVTALAEALAEVATDASRRARLIERGLTNVARFSWSECVDGMVGLYTQAIAAR